MYLMRVYIPNDNFRELALNSYQVGPGDQTHVTRLGDQQHR